MRQSQSAVLEMALVLDGPHETEPFEVAWAGEARWFVHFLEEAPDTRLSFQVQISPNGILWLDHEQPALEAAATGVVSLPSTQFGHWLRLRSTPVSGDKAPTARIYLELKE